MEEGAVLERYVFLRFIFIMLGWFCIFVVGIALFTVFKVMKATRSKFTIYLYENKA